MFFWELNLISRKKNIVFFFNFSSSSGGEDKTNEEKKESNEEESTVESRIVDEKEQPAESKTTKSNKGEVVDQVKILFIHIWFHGKLNLFCCVNVNMTWFKIWFKMRAHSTVLKVGK